MVQMVSQVPLVHRAFLEGAGVLVMVEFQEGGEFLVHEA
jgi:hypothetical protein